MDIREKYTELTGRNPINDIDNYETETFHYVKWLEELAAKSMDNDNKLIAIDNINIKTVAVSDQVSDQVIIKCNHEWVGVYENYHVSYLKCLNCPETKPF